MIELLKLVVICFSVGAIALPIAFLVAFSLPHNSDMRQFTFKVCQWGIALLSVGYFAMPIDVVPDVIFPFGFADDLVALGIGFAHFKKAIQPRAAAER